MSPRRIQPCSEACPFVGEQRGSLGCRPTVSQVKGLGADALQAYALCMTERMERRDVDKLTGLLTYDRFMAEAERHIAIQNETYGRRVKSVPSDLRSALISFKDGD